MNKYRKRSVFMESRLGVSSACYYPLETEKSLALAGEYGFKNIEVFLNSPSELEDAFIRELIQIRDKYDMNIVSVHPFQSFAESFYLFGNYERRWHDALPLYDKMFKVTSQLGADIFVIHGAKIPGAVDDEEYCNRFHHLIKMGGEYGVRVCHENVVHHRSESPSYLKMMGDYIGKDFNIVFDIKQAYKAGYSYEQFLDRLAERIVHIHISDRNEEKDCITPLTGNFDFDKFFKDVIKTGYDGKFMIELYNWSYKHTDEIAESYRKLTNIMNNI